MGTHYMNLKYMSKLSIVVLVIFVNSILTQKTGLSDLSFIVENCSCYIINAPAGRTGYPC